MKILGISAFYHDSAAALIIDGQIVAAAQEERFTRKKHDEEFPKNAIDYCLSIGGITADQLDYVVFYEKPFLKFERLLETYVANAPQGFQSFRVAIKKGKRYIISDNSDYIWKEDGEILEGTRSLGKAEDAKKAIKIILKDSYKDTCIDMLMI